MKAIHYDAEGDILSVTFSETGEQNHTGIELSDNIVLYYNPDTEQPLKIIFMSYQAMLQASTQTPILLDGIAQYPSKIRSSVMKLLQELPLTGFIKFSGTQNKRVPSSQLQEIFMPSMLDSLAVI